MAPTKINNFLTDADEKFIVSKVNKMLYFWPRQLKKNSRKDYRKKIALGYRVLKHHPQDNISSEELEAKLFEGFKQLGSQKDKYLKDILHKIVTFEKFKQNEPECDYPQDEFDKEEKPLTQKQIQWKEIKDKILAQAYQQFTNAYVEPAEEVKLPLEDDIVVDESA